MNIDFTGVRAPDATSTIRKRTAPVAKRDEDNVILTLANGTTSECSPQQSAFIRWAERAPANQSCVLEAVAGSGKTTTIIEAATRMRGSRLICAYNNKIAKEIKGKLEARGVNWRDVSASTVHSLGFRTYRKTYSDAQVVENKTYMIIETLIDTQAQKEIIKPTLDLVSLAKQTLVDPLDRDETPWAMIIDHFALDFPDGFDVIPLAREVLKRSLAQRDAIDFDDMIYMPIMCKLSASWQYDTIFIDEAQDTNKARRMLVAMHLRPRGRVVAVGDPHQAIYGFTGADAESLNLIRDQFNAITMHLGVTFRCPRVIVERAQQYVSHITAADTASEGAIAAATCSTMLQSPSLATSAVLSRTTRPLVQLAFKFIRQRVACRIEGRDVGGTLKKLAMKWKTRDFGRYDEMLDKHLERMKTKYETKQPRTYANICDTVETLKAIMNDCRARKQHNMDYVVQAIDELFSDDVKDMLTLSTIHKSKGREWHDVYLLDFEEQYAAATQRCRSDWEADQEINLCYVAVTRAMSTLNYLNSAMP